MNQHIAPCPHCGSVRVVGRTELEPPPHPKDTNPRTEPWNDSHQMFYIVCLDCGCGTMPVENDMVSHAVARWNRRVKS